MLKMWKKILIAVLLLLPKAQVQPVRLMNASLLQHGFRPIPDKRRSFT